MKNFLNLFSKNKENKNKSESLIKNKENKNIGNSNIALEVLNFSKKYFKNKDYTVKKASFKVYPGEFHGFVGANGSGKTTTIKSLIGAYAKFEGQISIFGYKHSSIKAKKKIGYIPETTNFPKQLNAYQYLKYMCHLSGTSLKKSGEMSIKLLKSIGLTELKKRNPSTFSSGQKKKLLLAQALIGDPDLIIMDEPAANLDPQARSNFFNLLKKLQNEGKAIFISSHILSELDQYVDSATILNEGKIVFSGKINHFLKNANFEYLLKTVKIVDEEKIIEFLKNNKINFQKQEQGIINIILHNSKNYNILLSFIQNSKIPLSIFKENIPTLQEIYNKYIKSDLTDPRIGGKIE